MIELRPITFKEACEYVDRTHRHHKKPVGHKFSIAIEDEQGTIRGVIMVGRPVARSYDDGLTLEITRCATDGTKNANSKLYGAAVRVAFSLGYRRVITYTEEGESGASMKASGFRVLAVRDPRKGWACPSRERDNAKYRSTKRYLWEAAAGPSTGNESK